MPRCGPISACQPLGALKGPLRSPFAFTGRDLPLPRPLKSTMLASKPQGSGECRLKHYIDELSVTGLTANPTILDHAIKNSASYDAAIREKLKEGKSGGQSSANY